MCESQRRYEGYRFLTHGSRSRQKVEDSRVTIRDSADDSSGDDDDDNEGGGDDKSTARKPSVVSKAPSSVRSSVEVKVSEKRVDPVPPVVPQAVEESSSISKNDAEARIIELLSEDVVAV